MEKEIFGVGYKSFKEFCGKPPTFDEFVNQCLNLIREEEENYHLTNLDKLNQLANHFRECEE